MADLIDVAIEFALLSAVDDFAAEQSIDRVSKPNIQFAPPPTSGPADKWLRATLLPLPTIRRAIADQSPAFYSGLLQIDCFMGQGAGLNLSRLAGAAVAWFPPGKRMQLPELALELLIVEQSYRAPVFEDQPWFFIPVRVPYQIYA
jgi:hypothetical protein